MNNDEEHLRLLSIFHYVVGGMASLFGCIFIMHIVMGLVFILAPETVDAKNEMPAFFGWMFFVPGLIFFISLEVLAACIIIAGCFLSKRKHYLYCLVIGGVNCIFVPVGTVLGVFTIIILTRPGVKALFEGGAEAEATG